MADSLPTPPERRLRVHRPATPHRPPQEHNLFNTLWLIFMAVVIGLGITAFGFRSYDVDGASMENTLQNNDRVIIDKIPRSIARLTHHPYLPHRGDIIIFSQFGFFDNSGPGSRQLIKRVIGLPGEQVVVKDGQVSVINTAHPNGFNPDTSGLYHIDAKSTPGNVKVTVLPGSVFVLGDNRANSTDSRFFGLVKAEQIVGKLVLRFWPLSQSKGF